MKNTKDTPLVSVVIPAFNAEKTIEDTIKSIAEQTYKHLEIIVVDDGSTDKTTQRAKINKVTVISQKNMGAGAARNTGIKEARGEYVVFCDADDSLDKCFVEKMLKAAQNHNESLVVCGMELNNEMVLPKYAGLKDRKLKEHVLKAILKDSALYSPCNKIYKTEIIKKSLFPIDVVYGEDLIFNLRYLTKVKSVFYLNEALYEYNLSSNGSVAKNSTKLSDRKQALAELVKYAGKTTIKEKFLIYLIKIRWYLSVIKNRARKLWKH